MSYCHLSSEERYVISHLVLSDLSLREIGRRINRHPSTISREIKRKGKYGTGMKPFNSQMKSISTSDRLQAPRPAALVTAGWVMPSSLAAGKAVIPIPRIAQQHAS